MPRSCIPKPCSEGVALEAIFSGVSPGRVPYWPEGVAAATPLPYDAAAAFGPQNGSVKYENIYLRAYETGTQLRRGLTEYFDFYNARRTHQALDYQTPDDVYYGGDECRLAA